MKMGNAFFFVQFAKTLQTFFPLPRSTQSTLCRRVLEHPDDVIVDRQMRSAIIQNSREYFDH